MNVGILTFHYAFNYGAVLQAYGLQQALSQMGFTARVIDYRAPSILSHNNPRGLRTGRFIYVFPMRWRFEAFRKKYLRLTERLPGISRLAEETRNYDALIVGSDQVWNTSLLKGVDPAYHLGISGGFRRISYAACIGQSAQLEGSEERASALLKAFDSLSVRDETSKDYVTKLTGRIPSLVVDPSLLHSYSELETTTRHKAKPFILVYSIWPEAEQTSLAGIVQGARKVLGYQVLSISQMFDFKLADRHIRTAGPVEWNQCFREAAFVCTDSFHGAVFAVKYRKPFIAVSHNPRSFRISEFLNRHGLQDRLVGKQESSRAAELYVRSINYPEVYRTLGQDIDYSRKFLVNALSDDLGGT